MSPNSEAVAKEITQKSMCFPDYLGNAATRKYTMKLITDALTRYAAQQVRATWEEASKLLEPPSGTGHWIVGEDLLRNLWQEFHRRSQEEKPPQPIGDKMGGRPS